MKIQVRHKDGRIEILNLVGKLEVTEPSPQGCIYVPATGARHFFHEDGAYDGWEMELNATMKDGEDPNEFMRKYAEGVDSEREFLEEQ